MDNPSDPPRGYVRTKQGQKAQSSHVQAAEHVGGYGHGNATGICADRWADLRSSERTDGYSHYALRVTASEIEDFGSLAIIPRFVAASTVKNR